GRPPGRGAHPRRVRVGGVGRAGPALSSGRPTRDERTVSIMKFAVFTASTPEWTPEEAAEELAAAGYDGVEWRITDQAEPAEAGFWSGTAPTWPFTGLADRVPRIAEVTARHGLEISGLGTYVRCDDPEGVEAALAAAKALGVPQLRVTLPVYDPAGSFR